MSERTAAMRSLMTGTAALTLGVAIGLFGCDRSGDQTSVVPRTPSGPPPSTEDATLPEEVVRRDLDPVPDLGPSVTDKHADGEIWSKYSSGLATYDIRPGSGLRPQVGQTAHVHYKGTFPDGRVFDQSMDKPFEFVLGSRGIIKGWNLAVSTMSVGGKRKIYLPASLAYGARGSLPTIYPNQDLLFEIELLSVTGKPARMPETKPADTQAFKAPTMGPATAPATAPK